MKDIKTIEQTVAAALEGKGVELVDLVIQNQGHKKLLQFFVDKSGGITLDDCSALSDSIDAVTLTGCQTVVGSSYNVPSAAVIKNAANEDVTASYDITYTNGTLEVTQKAVTITAASDTKV